MPKLTGTTHQTWMIDQSNKTWTLVKDAKIVLNNNGHGIYEAGQSGNTINVLGDIKVTGMAYGVYLNGSTSEVLVGEDSKIDASLGVSGIYSAAAGGHIENRGLIDGFAYGIQGQIWSDIENYGTIRGKDGISHDGNGSQIYNYGTVDARQYGIVEFAGGTQIENGKNGEISGDEKAIFLMDSGTAEIVNKGILRGDVAIDTAGDIQTVTNTGKIIGDVKLGEDADIFDSRNGSVKGTVEGGDGDDTYYIGSAKYKIVEDSAGTGGDDKVFSSVNYKLTANVEELHLTGNKDIDGTGNGGVNDMYGNSGNNDLDGGGSSDYLRGLGGDDNLTGGAAQDWFIFSRQGVDHITDFEDGLDLVVINGVDSQQEFDDLNIKEVHGDTVINFGNGNKVIIDGVSSADFTYADIGVLT